MTLLLLLLFVVPLVLAIVTITQNGDQLGDLGQGGSRLPPGPGARQLGDEPAAGGHAADRPVEPDGHHRRGQPARQR